MRTRVALSIAFITLMAMAGGPSVSAAIHGVSYFGVLVNGDTNNVKVAITESKSVFKAVNEQVIWND